MSFFYFIYIDILYPSTARVWTGDTVIYDNNKPNCNFFIVPLEVKIIHCKDTQVNTSSNV